MWFLRQKYLSLFFCWFCLHFQKFKARSVQIFCETYSAELVLFNVSKDIDFRITYKIGNTFKKKVYPISVNVAVFSICSFFFCRFTIKEYIKPNISTIIQFSILTTFKIPKKRHWFLWTILKTNIPLHFFCLI